MRLGLGFPERVGELPRGGGFLSATVGPGEQGAATAGDAQLRRDGSAIVWRELDDAAAADLATTHLAADGHGDAENHGGYAGFGAGVALDPAADHFGAFGGALTA